MNFAGLHSFDPRGIQPTQETIRAEVRIYDDTSLRRAMVDFQLSGGQFRSSGAFCLLAGWGWGIQRDQTR